MDSEAARNVWNEIVDAFPPVTPSQPVTLCDCEECLEVRANLGHVAWNHVLPPAIEHCFGSLPPLTDESFHALLPAYLLHAFADLGDHNKVFEWTLYSLCGPEDGADHDPEDAGLREKAMLFSPEQRRAVRSFLFLAGSVREIREQHDVMGAAATIWR